MFELLIIIIICISVYKRVQRVKGDGSVKGNNSLPNTTVTTANQNAADPYTQKNPQPDRTSASSAAQNTGRTQTRPNKTAQSAIAEAQEDGHSTTAYLMEKAEADAREHAKEKYEEQKRLYETRGGLAVAERYLDGEPVPQGKRCVACGYCGAENLVPMLPRTRYSCYFCREAL